MISLNNNYTLIVIIHDGDLCFFEFDDYVYLDYIIDMIILHLFLNNFRKMLKMEEWE